VTGAKRDDLFDLCRSLPGVTEDVKWGDNLVFSVGGKMFAVFDLPAGEPVSVKVDEDRFDLMIQQSGMRPAPYLAKHSWVAVDRRDTMPSEVLEDLLREAHGLVAGKLPKRVRRRIGA
jgi:predicted DNA-binding protein (MmcQ/YjbR family)